MRSLHELYLILWEEIKDKEFIDGLCHEMSRLFYLMKEEEYNLLENHFKSQKPTKELHSEFLKSNTWCDGSYWWSFKEDNNPVNRKAFIQKMIEITKENDNTPKD